MKIREVTDGFHSSLATRHIGAAVTERDREKLLRYMELFVRIRQEQHDSLPLFRKTDRD